MTKFELIAAVAKEAGVTKKDTTAVVDAFLKVIPPALKSGEKIILAHFGTFSQKTVAARIGRNPATGETLSIPEKKKLVFKFSKTL